MLPPVRADSDWPGSLSLLSLCPGRQGTGRGGLRQLWLGLAELASQTAAVFSPRYTPGLLSPLPAALRPVLLCSSCYTQYNTTSNWYFLLEIKLHNTPLPSLSPVTHHQAPPLSLQTSPTRLINIAKFPAEIEI